MDHEPHPALGGIEERMMDWFYICVFCSAVCIGWTSWAPHWPIDPVVGLLGIVALCGAVLLR